MNELMFLGRALDGRAIAEYSRRLSRAASLNHSVREALKAARAKKPGEIISLPTAAEEAVLQPEETSETNLPTPSRIIEHDGVTLRVFTSNEMKSPQADSQIDPLTEQTTPAEQVAHVEHRMVIRTEEEIAQLKAAGGTLLDMLRDVQEMLEKTDPEKWFRALARKVLALEKNMKLQPDSYHESVKTYVTDYLLPQMRTSLKGQASRERTQNLTDMSVAALDLMHEISDAVPFVEPENPIIHEVSLEELLTSDIPQGYEICLKKRKDKQAGGLREYISVYSPTKKDWFDFPLPSTDNIMHKGGFPRVILKLLAHGPLDSIEAELPPNDFDVIGYGESHAIYEEAAKMGVDQEGVELMPSLEDLGLYLQQRDTTLNQAFMGRTLYYTDQAWEAAKSGVIDNLPHPRKLYGDMVIHHKGTVLSNGRAQMRLAKFVVEGKALGFDFLPLNEQIEMGCYALTLIRKFMKKKNAPELLDKFYYLLQQMHQVKPGEENIIDVMDRIHTENSFFDLESGDLSPDGVVKWLNRKLITYIYKRYKMQYAVPGDVTFERKEDDLVPYRVSLDGYTSDPDRIQMISEGLEGFMQRSRERAKAYDELPQEIKAEIKRQRVEHKTAMAAC